MQGKGKSVAMAALGAAAALFAGAAGKAAPAPLAAQEGQALASKLCSSCHETAPAGEAVRSAATAATFTEIANRPAQTPERLKGFMLSPPHPAMPQIQLTRDEIDAIAAYILSLKKP